MCSNEVIIDEYRFFNTRCVTLNEARTSVNYRTVLLNNNFKICASPFGITVSFVF